MTARDGGYFVQGHQGRLLCGCSEQQERASPVKIWEDFLAETTLRLSQKGLGAHWTQAIRGNGRNEVREIARPML